MRGKETEVKYDAFSREEMVRLFQFSSFTEECDIGVDPPPAETSVNVVQDRSKV